MSDWDGVHGEYWVAAIKEEVEPCCALYKVFFLADHEYDCPDKRRAERFKSLRD